MLSSTMTTTSDVSMYLPSFIVDTPDIKEPKLELNQLELNQLTIQPKISLTQIEDSKTKNRCKDFSLQLIGIRILGIW